MSKLYVGMDVEVEVGNNIVRFPAKVARLTDEIIELDLLDGRTMLLDRVDFKQAEPVAEPLTKEAKKKAKKAYKKANDNDVESGE